VLSQSARRRMREMKSDSQAARLVFLDAIVETAEA
jgi:hypothetical protein